MQLFLSQYVFLFALIILIVLLFVTSLTKLYSWIIKNYFPEKDEDVFQDWLKFLFLSKIGVLLLSFLLLMSGVSFINSKNSLEAFIGAFLITIAIQIGLWAIGIRLEILGTADSNVDVINDD